MFFVVLFCKRDRRLIKWPPAVAVVVFFLRCSAAAGRLSVLTALFCNVVFCQRHDPAWPFEEENKKKKTKKKRTASCFVPVAVNGAAYSWCSSDTEFHLSNVTIKTMLIPPPGLLESCFQSFHSDLKGYNVKKKCWYKSEASKQVEATREAAELFFKTSGNNSDKRLKDIRTSGSWMKPFSFCWNPHWVVKRFQHGEMTAWRRQKPKIWYYICFFQGQIIAKHLKV